MTARKRIYFFLHILGHQLSENKYLFAEDFEASANSVILAIKELVRGAPVVQLMVVGFGVG